MLRVECVSHGGREVPRLLLLDDRKIFVEEVLDTWAGPDHQYFKLKGDDGDVYIIRHDPASRGWELTVSRQGK